MSTQAIQVPDSITVGELAKKINIPVTKLIAELMKSGIMATVNEKLDVDTAEIVIGELGLDITVERQELQSPTATGRKKYEISEQASSRPPIIAVMGHVDHGKTTLLDAIRGSDKVSEEAGGITQHISAYQATHNGRLVTFLDTPGHEAFSALRAHGAQLTDLAILVVAADDGVKPQTKEAVRFIKEAGVKTIVAINKIDKEGANPNMVRQQLNDIGLIPEEWGGDVVMVEISGKTKQGLDKLLDLVLLSADIEELKADVNVPAEGIIIESHMETGKGPVATLLVERGKLTKSSYIVAGDTYAKIRTLTDYSGKSLREAPPSSPAIITGFKKVPQFGKSFIEMKNEKSVRLQAEKQDIDKQSSTQAAMSSSDLLNLISKKRDSKEVPVIIKADVQGSLRSVIDSFESLKTKEIEIRIIGSGVGNITENDIRMAATGRALVYGFNVALPNPIKRLAEQENVRAKVFSVIYELIDDARGAMSALLEPEVVETDMGRLIIKGVFRTTKNTIICGGEVTKGKVLPGLGVKILRNKDKIAEAKVSSVKKQTQEVKEVIEGEMCGLQLDINQKIILEEGDALEFFKRETIARKL